MKIAHLTSVHTRYDTRIYLKQCRSLAQAGYEVHLIVADGKGDELREKVVIHDVGAPSGRLQRMYHVTRSVHAKALDIGAEIYHLHDPELIPLGLKLRRQGKIVVFDAHEDLPKQILGKPYLNPLAKIVLSKLLGVYEYWACRKFNAVVTATPWIAEKFKSINSNTVAVNNYPMIGELAIGGVDWALKKNEVSYIGGITEIRGILQVVEAMEELRGRVRLQLGGRFSDRGLEHKAKSTPGWKNVDELGFVDRAEVAQILSRSVAGVVTFLPAPNHIDAQPNKMFEYMSAGIPVVASNFPLWQEIIDGNQCGVCVDPLNGKAIAAAIDYLATHPAQAEAMGRRGQDAVLKKYNWSIEAKSLVGLYSKLIAGVGQ